MKRRNTGVLGEKLARDFIKKRKYRILETNYRCPHGEIDIIARHKDFLVFIEVRTKTGLEFGRPEESITLVKKERIKAAAAHYQQTHDKLPQFWRIHSAAKGLKIVPFFIYIPLGYFYNWFVETSKPIIANDIHEEVAGCLGLLL
jgi:putative endonuclease